VDGRPSRRKKEPGIRPAAYIRSSTSTVSGKKSNWSLGCLDAVVADSSIVSSSRWATTAPAACRASRPVSNRTVRVPKTPLSSKAIVSCTWVEVLVVGSVNSSPPRGTATGGTIGAGTRTADRSSIEAPGACDLLSGATTEDRRTTIPTTGDEAARAAMCGCVSVLALRSAGLGVS